MKLTRIMHPEYVLGRRGDEHIIRYYREGTRNIEVEPTGGIHVTGVATRLVGQDGAHDQNIVEHLVLCRLFKERGRAFYISKGLLEALSKIDREIPIDYLPDRFIGFFQFPPGVLTDDTGPVDGGYVFVGPPSEIGLRGDPAAKVIAISYLNSLDDGIHWGVISRFCVEARQEKVDELSESLPTQEFFSGQLGYVKDPHKLRLSTYRAFINAVLFVNSEDPEVMKLRPMSELTHKQRKEQKQKYPVENDCTIQVTVLGWSYHQRQYSADSTVVQMHQRWQRVGPGLSKIKLVWVREHTRHYKQEEKNGETIGDEHGSDRTKNYEHPGDDE